MALESPAAKGSIVLCQPDIVWSTQSNRVAELGAVPVAGKESASSNKISEISNALATTANYFAPIGFNPRADTNFLAVSRTAEIERT